MKKFISKYIAHIASIISVINFLYSLVYYNYKKQNPSGFSYGYLIITILIQILWLIYGYTAKINPIFYGAIVYITGFIYIIYLKMKVEKTKKNKAK